MTSSTDSFPGSLSFAISHIIEFCSFFEGLQASLTHNRVWIPCGKISNLVIGWHGEWDSESYEKKSLACGNISVGYALSLTRILYLQKSSTPLHANRHLFCTSKAEDEDKPTITVPFSTLWHIIKTHQKQQGYIDINWDIKRHAEGDVCILWSRLRWNTHNVGRVGFRIIESPNEVQSICWCRQWLHHACCH